MSRPGTGDRPDQAAIAQVFRRESGQVVATLVRVFGDIDIAEDAVQEAFAVAAEKWPLTGMPPNPGGWITTTARRRAIDRLRREATRDQRHAQAALLQSEQEGGPVETLHDDRLRLIFTCCHPALSVPAQIALTLRLLGGLQTDEIARAFVVPQATIAQRLVRAGDGRARAGDGLRRAHRRRAAPRRSRHHRGPPRRVLSPARVVTRHSRDRVMGSVYPSSSARRCSKKRRSAVFPASPAAVAYASAASAVRPRRRSRSARVACSGR